MSTGLLSTGDSSPGGSPPVPPHDGLPSRPPAPAPASHRDLLDMALGVQRAAAADDPAAVHRDLRRLRSALVGHVLAERDDHERLGRPARRIVQDGQQRLMMLVDDLLARTASDACDCNCLVRAVALRSALGRQAHLESGLLAGPAAVTARRPGRRSRRRP
jgi:hypothetical protein